MKHDIKKLITDYLDGLVGKTIKVYKWSDDYTLYPHKYSEPLPFKIISVQLTEDIDYFSKISFDLGDNRHRFVLSIYLDNDMPIFETID